MRSNVWRESSGSIRKVGSNCDSSARTDRRNAQAMADALRGQVPDGSATAKAIEYSPRTLGGVDPLS